MLSSPARKRALNEILRGPLVVGLGYAIADDGGFYEVDDPAYQPQAVTMGPPEDLPGEVACSNTAEIVFPPFEGDAGGPVSYWYVADPEGGLVATGELEPLPDGSHIQPYAGWVIRIAPGLLSIGLKP